LLQFVSIFYVETDDTVRKRLEVYGKDMRINLIT